MTSSGEQSESFNEQGSPLVIDTEQQTVQTSTITEKLIVEDDDDLAWGTDEDYITEYDSSADVWRVLDNGTNNNLLSLGTTELVFNEDGADLDLRVEGDTDTDLLRTDAGNDRVGVGTASPSTLLDVDGGNLTVSTGNIDLTGGPGYLDFGAFTDGNEPTASKGRVFFSDEEEVLSYYDTNGVEVNIGQDVTRRAKNVTGATINKGDVVYVSGSSGSNPEVGLAQANDESTARPVGVVFRSSIGNNAVGKVLLSGRLQGVDTSAFTAGDRLYLDPNNAGGITATKPSYPDIAVRVGTVVSSGASGEIDIDIDREADIFTQGSVFFGDANGRIAEDSNNLFWDDTNSELGIGTNTPAATLDIRGDTLFGGDASFDTNTSLVHDRQDVSTDVSTDGSGYYSIDSSGAIRTLTIASTDEIDGREINVKRNGSNNVNINTHDPGTTSIDDASSTPQFTLSSDNASVTLVYNSTNDDWEVY